MLVRLKQLRMERGLSQQRIAEVISVTQQSVNRYENHDVEPDIDVLKKLADYFDTSIDYLVGRTDLRHKVETSEAYPMGGMEYQLLRDFRSLTGKQKRSVLFVMEAYLDKNG